MPSSVHVSSVRTEQAPRHHAANVAQKGRDRIRTARGEGQYGEAEYGEEQGHDSELQGPPTEKVDQRAQAVGEKADAGGDGKRPGRAADDEEKHAGAARKGLR